MLLTRALSASRQATSCGRRSEHGSNRQLQSSRAKESHDSARTLQLPELGEDKFQTGLYLLVGIEDDAACSVKSEPRRQRQTEFASRCFLTLALMEANCIWWSSADDVVPVFDGDLAGDDGRGATVAIIENLEKVAPFGRIENRQPPIVEYQELNAAEGFEHAAIATVAAREGESLEQAWDAMVLDRTIVATGLVAEGAGNPTLADPGRDSVTMPGVRRSRF